MSPEKNWKSFNNILPAAIIPSMRRLQYSARRKAPSPKRSKRWSAKATSSPSRAGSRAPSPANGPSPFSSGDLPGCGKTTLARLYAKAFDAEFVIFSAVLHRNTELQKNRRRAPKNHPLLTWLVFVDEITSSTSRETGLLPLRRERNDHLDRRDHRKSFVFSQQRAPLPCAPSSSTRSPKKTSAS